MIKIICSDKNLPVDEKALFDAGFVLSNIVNINNSGIISDGSKSIEKKVKEIIQKKKEVLKVINEIDEKKLLSLFTHDGGIRIKVEDLEEIVGSLYLVGEDIDGGKQKVDVKTEDHPFIHALLDDFCYFGKNSVDFRNRKYYFLYDSLKFSKVGKHTSINDYEVTDIDFESFAKEIYGNYNRIDQHLKMFLDYFSGHTNYNIMERYLEFRNDILNIFSKNKIDALKKAIEISSVSPDKDFNERTKEDLLNLTDLIEELVDMVSAIKLPLDLKSDNHIIAYLQYIDKITKFISYNSVLFNNIKNIFNIDINEVFKKYVYTEIPTSMKKVVLGLLDAKINILAFMQNMTQILFNENFLNPDFSGSLVLRKEQLDYIKKINPKLINEFKEFQSNITKDSDTNNELATELNATIGYFLDILIGDRPESYIYATASIRGNLKEINEGYDNSNVELFEPTIALFGKLLEQVEKFCDDLDEIGLKSHEKEVKKAEKKCKPLPPLFEKRKNVSYRDVKRNVLKKLIRLHREENNPVVMVNTAQNAYNHIYTNGLNNNDSLHLLSVNYGGSIIGYYAKHTFERLHGKNILINLGNIVYSIYDLKNASDFLKIVDYPFVTYMEQFDSSEMKNFFSGLNHAIIFDDNTCSGRTLNNLAILSKQSGYYGKVDIFACRVSQRLQGYDISVSDETKLNLIKNASLESRKTKVGQVKRNYKELIGTIIGRNMYYSWGKYRKREEN